MYDHVIRSCRAAEQTPMIAGPQTLDTLQISRLMCQLGLACFGGGYCRRLRGDRSIVWLSKIVANIIFGWNIICEDGYFVCACTGFVFSIKILQKLAIVPFIFSFYYLYSWMWSSVLVFFEFVSLGWAGWNYLATNQLQSDNVNDNGK